MRQFILAPGSLDISFSELCPVPVAIGQAAEGLDLQNKARFIFIIASRGKRIRCEAVYIPAQLRKGVTEMMMMKG